MKNLTESQLGRLDEATSRVDQLAERRQLSIPDETALVAVIDTFDTAVRLLEAGETIRVAIVDENGQTVASAQLVLENP